MTVTRHQRNSETNEAPPPSSELSAKLLILKTSQALFSRELTEEESKFWRTFLEPIPVKLLREAFDNWNRNWRFFPKPKDISDLVETYKFSKRQEFRSCGNCEEGWIYLYEGKTAKGNDLKKGERMVQRCQCFLDWRSRKVA